MLEDEKAALAAELADARDQERARADEKLAVQGELERLEEEKKAEAERLAAAHAAKLVTVVHRALPPGRWSRLERRRTTLDESSPSLMANQSQQLRL